MSVREMISSPKNVGIRNETEIIVNGEQEIHSMAQCNINITSPKDLKCRSEIDFHTCDAKYKQLQGHNILLRDFNLKNILFSKIFKKIKLSTIYSGILPRIFVVAFKKYHSNHTDVKS